MTPNPGVDEQPDTDPVEFEFPLPYTTELASVRIAPATDDRLWVIVQERPWDGARAAR